MLLNMHVSDRSEAAAAVKEISEILKKKYPGLDAGVGTILCDSLLNHLLFEGFRDIKVILKGRISKYIEVTAAGSQATLELYASGNEKELIEDEINISIINLI